MTHDRSDPLSTALACVRRLSDEGLRDLASAVHSEESARYRDRLARARWRGTRQFTSRAGRLRRAVCLVVGPDLASGLSGYWRTLCDGVGYGVEGEPDAITCRDCLARGAGERLATLRGGPA